MLDPKKLLSGAVLAGILALQSGAQAGLDPGASAGIRHMLVLSETLKKDAGTRAWGKAQGDVHGLRSVWKATRPAVVSNAHGTRYAYGIDQNLTGLSNAVLGMNAASVVQTIKFSNSMQRSLNDLLEKKWDLL